MKRRLLNFKIDPILERKLEILAEVTDRNDKSKMVRALINEEWRRQLEAGRVSDSMLSDVLSTETNEK